MHRSFIYNFLLDSIRTSQGRSGFSLIDVLLVVAIFTIVMSSAVSIVPRRTSNEDLYSKSKQIVEFVAQARNYSMSGYFGDVWGIKVLNDNAACQDSGDCLILFKGKAYSYRDSSYDRVLQLDTGAYIDEVQSNEFYFSYKAGWLSTTTASNLAEQSIVLHSNIGDTKTIRIAPTGMAYIFTCGDDYVYDIEGQAYRTVQIADQCWMAENLNTGTMLADAATDPTDNGVIEKWCYSNSASNCDTYGGLYMWDEAMDWVTTEGAQGICPEGWHIPAENQLGILSSHYSGNGTAWKEHGVSGFELKLAGEMNGDSDIFDELGAYGIVYGSTEAFGTFATVYYVDSGSNVTDDLNAKTYGFSIRCLKD